MRLPRTGLVTVAIQAIATFAMASQAPAPAVPPTASEPVPVLPDTPSKPVDPAVAEAERRLAERPDSPERLYNLGVALYRAGERTKAAERFREAATLSRSDILAARAMYNEGVAAYADAVDELRASESGSEANPPAAADPARLEEIAKRVESAFTHFRDASIADPDDRDARANAENARELIKLLKQAQQQQQQQQQDQQKQDQQKQDQQKQDQQKQDQQKQDQQKQDQQKQDQQKQDQQPQKPQSGAESKPEERPQGKLDRSTEGQPPPDAEPTPGEAVAGEMSREEAERLLQAVRDRERARRAALAEKAKAQRERTPPTRKDW